MIVVDTNIVAYLYLETTRTAAAERLLRRDADWAAPLLWRSELRNVLASEIARRGLSLHHAMEIQSEAESLLARHEYEVPSRAVLELAARSQCSAYDCEFVALAQALDVPLVTADEQILKAFPKVASRLK
ncbi:MAG TPA: VapC toxin family PIN domain ribonuclease [Gammaproteobacteria bacterium]|nr:VapC toxin family PIN domain ribonuclease [Gammaproteobacteria bacterium]